MTSAFVLSAIVLSVAMTIVAYMTWLERKVAARFQNRVGPYHVGPPHGWLQPLADIMKLIVKEDITPRAADRLLFNLGPVLVVVHALLGFAFIPLGPRLAVADHPQAHPVAVDLRDLPAQIQPQQAHEVGDFLCRPLPVLGGEAEHGQVLDPELGGGAHHAAERLGAFAMAGPARQPARLRPPAVAVHDDRDVPGNSAAVGGCRLSPDPDGRGDRLVHIRPA